MRITGARVAIDAANAVPRDFAIRNGRIVFSGPREWSEDEPAIDLSGFLILPGLINAHDHLELNLFPRLGWGRYGNAKAWAEEVYRPTVSPVREHLSLDKRIRLIWGGLKNLISGVTTVAHHNPYDDAFDDPGYPVRVVKEFGWAHSLDFSPDLRTRYDDTPCDWPFFLHAAEGVDSHARAEVRRLDQLGVLSDRTVLVHAIGIDQSDLELLQERRSSLAWCPSSNLSLYGETLPPSTLNSPLRIALGTDSAMTTQRDFCDEISMAHVLGKLTLRALYEMVTTRGAQVLCLEHGQGFVREGGVADLIAVADRGQCPAAALEQLEIEMTMVAGRVKLASANVLDRIRNTPVPCHAIEVEGRGKWFTTVNVPWLYQQTVEVLGSNFRLAGKRVSQGAF